MLREIERALRGVYGNVSWAPTGSPTEEDRDEIFAVLTRSPEWLPVVALWSASRAIVFPQLPAEALPSARRDMEASASMLSGGEAKGSEPFLRHLASSDGAETEWSARRHAAHRALLAALDLCRGPTPPVWRTLLSALEFAQLGGDASVDDRREWWIAWLDDVVMRCDRTNVATMHGLVERCLAGTLDELVEPYCWEGVEQGDPPYHVQVWTADPRTHHVRKPYLDFETFEFRSRKLEVVISRRPDVITDPLRIEYLVEMGVLRRYLFGRYEGRYDLIDYHCLATDERWTVEA